MADHDLTTEGTASKDRPDWVWVVLILFCIGAVINLVNFALLVLMDRPIPNKGDLCIMLVLMLVRGVGYFRLFFLKQDAWLFLLAALVISFLSNCCDFFLAHLSITSPGVLRAIFVHLYSGIVVYYAHRLVTGKQLKSV